MCSEVVAAGVGQGERAHSALEQGDPQLSLQGLDLMLTADGVTNNSSAAALKLCSLAATWNVFRNLSDG